MISICMAYYDRFDRFMHAIASLEKWYYADEIELIIVDDGSTEPLQFDSVLSVEVLRIDRFPVPRNPCTAINAAVHHANGDMIVLTSPEVCHDEPALYSMVETYDDGCDYVAAPCYDPERGILAGIGSPRGNKRAPMPEGADFPFCALLSKTLFYCAGGYDEDYRNGRAYDDNDFLWRLDRAGVCFKQSDVSVTHHHEKIKWNMPSNEPLFRSKWPDLFSS